MEEETKQPETTPAENAPENVQKEPVKTYTEQEYQTLADQLANSYDYVQELSLTDADFQKSLKSTALHYLGNTGLMFRGVE